MRTPYLLYYIEHYVVKHEVSVLFISVGVKQEDHNALLLEMQRLEEELSKIRGDLQGFAGCKGKCEQLNTLQQTVSSINIPATQQCFYNDLNFIEVKHFLLLLYIPQPLDIWSSVLAVAEGVEKSVLRQR